MAESESASFGKSVKSQVKYGSTNKSSITNDRFMKYVLEKGDTLQGIALKHCVTMETIKRVNQLWTNDSLYLRDYILIPLPNPMSNSCLVAASTNGVQSQHNGTSRNLNTDSVEIITRQDLMRNNKTVPRSKSCLESISRNCDQSSESTDIIEPNAKDFLKKFDFSIAEIKRNVERLDANTNFPEDSSNPLTLLPKRRSAYGRRQHHRSSMEDFSIAPDLAFVSGGTTVRTSSRLRRSQDNLQHDSDDMYQL